MHRKVLFSVYESLPFSPQAEDKLVWQRTVITGQTAEQLEAMLDEGEGFALDLLVGEQLTFVDFYTFRGAPEQAIHAIEAIRPSAAAPDSLTATGLFYRREEANEEPLSRNGPDIYQKRRFEQGASGVGETVLELCTNPVAIFLLQWAAAHLLDGAVQRLRRPAAPQPGDQLAFRCKRFYRQAAAFLQCDKKDLQITDCKREGRGRYHVKFRKEDGRRYWADCRPSGRIIRFKEAEKDKR